MNLPFGLPAIMEAVVKRKDESPEDAALYDRKIAEYRGALENYKKCLMEYSGRLDGYDKRSMDNQLAIVQTALDMTYLKEQSDRLAELVSDIRKDTLNKTVASLESLSASIVDTNDKLEGLDRNVVNRLSEMLLELQKQSVYHNRQLHAETLEVTEKLAKTGRGNQTLLWVILVFTLFGLSAVGFLTLYTLGIIPF